MLPMLKVWSLTIYLFKKETVDEVQLQIKATVKQQCSVRRKIHCV